MNVSRVQEEKRQCSHCFLLCLWQAKDNLTVPAFDNTEAWRSDTLVMLGILGFFLFCLLGLTSLPSVGGTLSWREFNFIQVRTQLEMCSYGRVCARVCVCVYLEPLSFTCLQQVNTGFLFWQSLYLQPLFPPEL